MAYVNLPTPTLQMLVSFQSNKTNSMTKLGVKIKKKYICMKGLKISMKGCLGQC